MRRMGERLFAFTLCAALVLSLGIRRAGAEGQETEAGSREALEAALRSGGSVTLTEDIHCGEVTDTAFVVAEGVSVSLDLNGHQITASLMTDEDTYSEVHVILNHGWIQIQDSRGGGVIANTSPDSFSCTRTVKNSSTGTLAVKDCTITSASAVAIMNLGICTIAGAAEVRSEKEAYDGDWKMPVWRLNSAAGRAAN